MTMHPVDRAALRPRVEKALAVFLAERRTHMAAIDDGLLPLADAVESFILGGGKRLRPAFAYWGYRGAGGEDRDDVVTALASLELVQASALMHDDLMDASDTRRGEPSVHRRFEALHSQQRWQGEPTGFGAAAALLLGDLCLVWSDELLHGSGLDPVVVTHARPVYDLMRTEVMVGQYLDVLTQASADTSVRRASQVARFKSAKYTVEHPLLFGAALAGAPAQLSAAYSAFGLPLGEAFQLRDDVLGVFGDPAATGKPAGDDLREGKRTYLIAMAFEGAGPDDRAELAAGLGRPDLDEAGVARLRQIITETGALAQTEAYIARLSSAALAALDAAPVDPEAAAVLRELAAAAVHRAT
ncbi:polyprenyl synthetase family protein [Catellatospora sp. KI3]|uniref:polyprenyl synthetase family protein n=1 Tax=Catellatospora sp. KI3 TaxID=3041620 RepID=UPI002482C161|nr:polyprenyl synthetase family protein [Catellatospora sp. KI3]MDI1464901.1 polyprenyl synthetase family protein [Catellatospora sp. KI3]